MRSAAAVVLFFFAASAHAHPGHGLATLWHLLTEPDHLAMILLPVMVVAGLWWWQAWRRRQSNRDSP